MSGQKIDLDEIRDQSAFNSAEIIIEDEDENESSNNNNNAEPVKIVEETFDQVVSQPSVKKSSEKIIKNDDGQVINSSTRKIKPESSTREIINAINETIKSSRKTERSNKRSSSARPKLSSEKLKEEVPKKKPRLPEQNSKTKPVTPEQSYRPNGSRKEDDDKPEDDDEESINMMPQTNEEKHAYWKTRLQILKTRFKDVTIPKNNQDMTWQELRKIYYIEMDRVSISKNVDAYRIIMILAGFLIEYIGFKFLKLDITGFGTHNMKSMWRYERLLIELGEKDYASFGENWPVEFRLIGMMLVSAVIFVIAKSLYKTTGQDMSNDFFRFFQDLGNMTVDTENNGMNAPNPNATEGNGGGLMGMLGGLLGGGGGGIADLFKNLMGGMNNGGVPPAEPTDTENLSDDDEERNRINPPRFRRRSRSERARENEE